MHPLWIRYLQPKNLCSCKGEGFLEGRVFPITTPVAVGKPLPSRKPSPLQEHKVFAWRFLIRRGVHRKMVITRMYLRVRCMSLTWNPCATLTKVFAWRFLIRRGVHRKMVITRMYLRVRCMSLTWNPCATLTKVFAWRFLIWTGVHRKMVITRMYLRVRCMSLTWNPCATLTKVFAWRFLIRRGVHRKMVITRMYLRVRCMSLTWNPCVTLTLRLFYLRSKILTGAQKMSYRRTKSLQAHKFYRRVEHL